MKAFLVLVLILGLSGCFRVPKSEPKARAALQKILLTYPNLLAGDTITIRDTVRLPATSADTSATYQTADTIVLHDTLTRTKVKIKVDTVRKTVYVKLEQKPYYIRQTVPKRVPFPVPVKEKWYVHPMWMGFGVVATILFLAGLLIIRRINSPNT